ncbi:hypothetical protein M569_09905 [Genlisea aurea]|uniref:At1g68980-like TPR repeats domain-containing protein n=1 Tax=Genlisea aurea TaxID=192259 RepID=S8DPE0_9LAMI|nr:hypothetical protein M569_09905 [Genlisea aurea]
MRRRDAVFLLSRRLFSSETEKKPTPLYSFLKPSLFSLTRSQQEPPPKSKRDSNSSSSSPPRKSDLEASIQQSLFNGHTDQAWKSFRALANGGPSSFPDKPLINSMITHLSSTNDAHNLKRAYASVIFALEKNPSSLEFSTVKSLLDSVKTAAPALALVKSMLSHRFFMPFPMWGGAVLDLCRKNGSLSCFLGVFRQVCRISLVEKLDFMKPDLAACNAALHHCCREVGSIVEAEKVIESMSILGIKPDESTYGSLAYLYAFRGLHDKITDLEYLMDKLGVSNERPLFHNLICGFINCGDFDSIPDTVFRALKGGNGLDPETCIEIVRSFKPDGNQQKSVLAKLIMDSQKVEPSSVAVESSFGYCIVDACIHLGLPEKAHGILDELNARGADIGLGIYIPILKVYCRERRTAEASQLVSEISDQGLILDVETYDALIESSMSCQDFRSAFSLFRDMRRARIPELQSGYLTIMTGLTEHRRPELMAAFLDEAVGDLRIALGTHDWNSIVHAFCKAGRTEDARRTARRMAFLGFEPDEQTYLSMVNGYAASGKFFSVLMVWNEVKRRVYYSAARGDGHDDDKKEKRLKVVGNVLVDALLYGLVKGGFFEAVMEVVELSREMKMFVDKWRYKQAYMEAHGKKVKKLSRMRKRNPRKTQALIAFRNWAGLAL